MYQTTILALASCAAAFPTLTENVLAKRQGVPDLTTTFDPKTQYVSTYGEHAFVAPDLAGGDQRGPCPGLNAMANHGYLPHNGVAGHTDFIQGTFDVFGMSADLSGFLTILGATIDGNGLKWSIGGPSNALPAPLGLLGQPQGISGSHNKYESDASPSRGDLYLNGDDFTIQMDQYQQLYDMAIANGDDIDLTLLNTFRSQRFDHSVANNPYFFNGPFTGVLVAPAAYSFIYRFMSNKSAEYPAGKLNTAILNSFFGVTKNADGSLQKNPGMERIPDNWYKRAIGDEYSIPYLNLDTTLAATRFPKFVSVGGNTGKVNTFTGLDPEDLTGGAYNSQTLLEGNNTWCFATQFLQQVMPDMLSCTGVLGNINGAVANVASSISSALPGLSCPKLEKPIAGQFSQFPGYTNLDCKTGNYN